MSRNPKKIKKNFKKQQPPTVNVVLPRAKQLPLKNTQGNEQQNTKHVSNKQQQRQKPKGAQQRQNTQQQQKQQELAPSKKQKNNYLIEKEKQQHLHLNKMQQCSKSNKLRKNIENKKCTQKAKNSSTQKTTLQKQQQRNNNSSNTTHIFHMLQKDLNVSKKNNITNNNNNNSSYISDHSNSSSSIQVNQGKLNALARKKALLEKKLDAEIDMKCLLYMIDATEQSDDGSESCPEEQRNIGVLHLRHNATKNILKTKHTMRPKKQNEDEKLCQNMDRLECKMRMQFEELKRFGVPRAQFYNPRNPCFDRLRKSYRLAKVGDIRVPIIRRRGRKFVCMRTIERKVFGAERLTRCDIFDACMPIKMYPITATEAKRLNDINICLHQCEFGFEFFKCGQDKLIKLADAAAFYEFVSFLQQRSSTEDASSSAVKPNRPCGFALTEAGDIFPYIVVDRMKVLPLFYFAEVPKALTKLVNYVFGWNLAYMKYCCQLIDVDAELLKQNFLAVVPLTAAKEFANGVEIEYWPHLAMAKQLGIF